MSESHRRTHNLVTISAELICQLLNSRKIFAIYVNNQLSYLSMKMPNKQVPGFQMERISLCLISL